MGVHAQTAFNRAFGSKMLTGIMSEFPDKVQI
jgi:hypothetical protein